MGITGLLPLLKDIQKDSHVSAWRGKRVAIDGYVWLHKGAYSCAKELATGVPTDLYIKYAINKLHMLLHHGITPILVFDGNTLPSKLKTESEREEKRRLALAEATRLSTQGKQAQALDFYTKAVDITPFMAARVIQAALQLGIQSIVAPYEADPQLAFLEREGIVDAIITEDSDLVIFGAGNILFKLDKEGRCVWMQGNRLGECGLGGGGGNGGVRFDGWTIDRVREMAILGGCDYLAGIRGVGVKRANELLRRFGTSERVLAHLRLSGRYTIPKDYADEFKRAMLTFRHQWVFDPRLNEGEGGCVRFEPLPPSSSTLDLDFLGLIGDDVLNQGIARGFVDPITKNKFSFFDSVNAPEQSAAYTYKMKESTSKKLKQDNSTPTILRFFNRNKKEVKKTDDTGRGVLSQNSQTRNMTLLIPSNKQNVYDKNKEETFTETTSKFFKSTIEPVKPTSTPVIVIDMEESAPVTSPPPELLSPVTSPTESSNSSQYSETKPNLISPKVEFSRLDHDIFPDLASPMTSPTTESNPGQNDSAYSDSELPKGATDLDLLSSSQKGLNDLDPLSSPRQTASEGGYLTSPEKLGPKRSSSPTLTLDQDQDRKRFKPSRETHDMELEIVSSQSQAAVAASWKERFSFSKKPLGRDLNIPSPRVPRKEVLNEVPSQKRTPTPQSRTKSSEFTSESSKERPLRAIDPNPRLSLSAAKPRPVPVHSMCDSPLGIGEVLNPKLKAFLFTGSK